MRNFLFLPILFLLFIQNASAQTGTANSSSGQQAPSGQQSNASQQTAQSPALAEAEQLSAQVVKLFGEGKYAQALPLAEQALAIREKELGPDHVLVGDALRNIAEIQIARGKSKEAVQTFQRLLSIYEKSSGTETNRLTRALERDVCLLVSLNSKEEAMKAQKRLYKLDNNFDYDESGNPRDKKPLIAGLLVSKAIELPKPRFPEEAKQTRAAGAVVLKLSVDEAGKVVAVKTLCGPPVFIKDTEKAVWNARFAPTMVAGQPVKVTGIVIYNFTVDISPY